MTAVNSITEPNEATPLLQNEDANGHDGADIQDTEAAEAAKPKVSRAAVVCGIFCSYLSS